MYSHTQAWKSKGQASSNPEPNGSGFDVTPAPSSRSSMSIAREYKGHIEPNVRQKDSSACDTSNARACLEHEHRQLTGWAKDDPGARNEPQISSGKDDDTSKQESRGKQDTLAG